MGESCHHITFIQQTHKTTNKMSEAEVNNDIAAEAPSAEELKSKKRSAEDSEVEAKKLKSENGKHEENVEEEEDAEEEEDIGEEEEDLDGEGEDDLDEEDGGEDDEEGEEEEGEGEEEEAE